MRDDDQGYRDRDGSASVWAEALLIGAMMVVAAIASLWRG